MYLTRGIRLFLLVAAAIMLPTALDHGQLGNLVKIRADGGAPPPPPLPWPTGAVLAPHLNADGGAPPPPPIPWLAGTSTTKGSFLTADGGAPPPPPLPWGSAAVGKLFLEV